MPISFLVRQDIYNLVVCTALLPLFLMMIQVVFFSRWPLLPDVEPLLCLVYPQYPISNLQSYPNYRPSFSHPPVSVRNPHSGSLGRIVSLITRLGVRHRILGQAISTTQSAFIDHYANQAHIAGIPSTPSGYSHIIPPCWPCCC